MPVAIAGRIETPEGHFIWIPPTGKPYWITGPKCPAHSSGPSLTEEEIKKYLTRTAK